MRKEITSAIMILFTMNLSYCLIELISILMMIQLVYWFSKMILS